MRSTDSPARNVLSTTLPVSSALSFVRTNAPPLPGLTCWKSTMRQTVPSIPMCIPLRNWLVLIVSATARPSPRVHEGLRVAREHLVPVVGDHDEVLDAHAEPIGKVHARLHRDDVSWLEHA